MEELLSKTTQLHVSDEEEWEIDQSLSSTIAKYNLRGRLVSNVDHSRGFLKKVLGRIWRLKEADWNIKIQEKYDTGMFLSFSFTFEQTQSRILAKMSWYLSNGLLILGKMVNTNESWKNHLTAFPISGRAMGVPTDYLTEKITLRLASMAGTVISILNSDVSKMVTNGFFRFQIWMSINKSVWPGYLLPCGGSKVWVAYKYDELPFMSFRCGRIGHNQKDCSLDFKEITRAAGEQAKAYRLWLKVDNEIKDGFHEGMRGSRKELQKDNREQSSIILPSQGLRVSNSFNPLVEEMEKRKSCSTEKLMINDTVSDLMEESKKNDTELAQQNDGNGQLEESGINEEQNRWKRRMVEDKTVMGFGKLQKTETDGIEGGPSFVFGPSQQTFPKAQKRKVDVKKDAKNRKCKTDGSPTAMKILLWNVQRMGNPWTVRTLKSLVTRWTPELVFTSDSRLKKVRVGALRVSLGFVGCFMVEAQGKSGGLILLWSNIVNCTILSFSSFHIDSFIRKEEGQWWRFTGFYGDPDPNQRSESWKLLTRIGRMYSGPWVIGGDFNEILQSKEKLGGQPKPGYLINNFRKALDGSNLREVDYEGSRYTWCNGRQNNLIERLDRVCGNPEWFILFPEAKVTQLDRVNSDHCPILLQCLLRNHGNDYGARWHSRFHFESAWAEKESCSEIITKTWGEGGSSTTTRDLKIKLAKC
uniref:Endonuclease/exonuclease/phosphatase domain-containing protein n=1 Tax=Cannabis sativa TaxID=3483 RepID=A0A803PC75_CANSA